MNEKKSEADMRSVENMKIARFYKDKKNNRKGFKANSDENIWLLVSFGNGMFSGKDLLAFFEMMARHQQTNSGIKKIKIIITDTLNVHYEKNLSDAIKLGTNWISENHDSWKEFEKINGNTVELVEWDKLKTSETKKRRNEIKKLYKTDEKFQTIVDKLANAHKNKVRVGDGLEKAKNYLFEEGAVLSYLDGHICYPDKELNEALKYIINYYQSKLIYDGYGIFTVDKTQKAERKKQRKSGNECNVTKRVSNNLLPVPMSEPTIPAQVLRIQDNISKDEELVIVSLQYTKYLETHGIVGSKNQTGFFAHFLEAKNKFSSSSGSDESPNTSARENIINNHSAELNEQAFSLDSGKSPSDSDEGGDQLSSAGILNVQIIVGYPREYALVQNHQSSFTFLNEQKKEEITENAQEENTQGSEPTNKMV